MPAVTDILVTLKQTRNHTMAKTKLIEVIVAREGAASRDATTTAVEKVIAFQINKGRIKSEIRLGAVRQIIKC